MTLGNLASNRYTDQFYKPKHRGIKSYKAGDDSENYQNAGAFLKNSTLTSGKSKYEVFIGQAFNASAGHWIDLPADEDDLDEYMDILGGDGDVIVATTRFPGSLNNVAGEFTGARELNELVMLIEDEYDLDAAIVLSQFYFTPQDLQNALEEGRIRYLEYEEELYDEYFMANYTIQDCVDAGLDRISYDSMKLELQANTSFRDIVENNGQWYAVF